MDGFHPAGVIRAGDPDRVVRTCDTKLFIRFVDEASAYRMLPHNQVSAMWRTPAAFADQVAADGRMIVLPILRNGGPASYPESLRCYLWFVDRASGIGQVTLVDLLKPWLFELPRLRNAGEFTDAIEFMLESSQLTTLRSFDD